MRPVHAARGKTSSELWDRELSQPSQNVRRCGAGWSARCTSHDDRNNSLSVSEGADERILVYCHAGCEPEAIVSALGLTMADLMAPRKQGGAVLADSRATVQPPGEAMRAQQEATGCTLAGHAQAKCLPMKFLEGLGLSDVSYLGRPAVKIPYRSRDGEETAVRFRTSVSGGDRFRWRRGGRPTLYGLDRFNPLANEVVLAEGESDVHTLWRGGFAALGIPGATNWKEERDAAAFDGIRRSTSLESRTAAGRRSSRVISPLSIRERAYVVHLNGFKASLRPLPRRSRAVRRTLSGCARKGGTLVAI